MNAIKTFLTTKSIYRVPVTISVVGLALVLLGLFIGVPTMIVASFTGNTTLAMVSGYCTYLPIVGMPILLVGIFADLGATLIDAARIDRAFWARYGR